MSDLKNNFSIVICTYNRSPLLKLCLNSLVKTENKHACIEIIVIDNNSKDNTKEVVNEYIKEYPAWTIKYVFEKKQGLSISRTTGYKNAKGLFIFYLDDDAQASANLLESISKNINNYDLDIFTGPIYPFYLKEKPVWFKDSYEIRTMGTDTLKLEKGKENVWGSNFGIKKELLDKTSGFDENMGMKAETISYGEEHQILEEIKKIKQDLIVYYFPNSFVYHYVPQNKIKLSYFIEKYFKTGYFGMLVWKEKKSFSKNIFEIYLILRIPLLVIYCFLFRNKKRYPYYQNYLIENVLPLLCYVGEHYAKMVCFFKK